MKYKEKISKSHKIRLIQTRVANVSIGSSTLRNQGASGVAKIARTYLAEIDMGQFDGIDCNKFNTLLQKHTKFLKDKFPKGARNWGTARKALNVFFYEACRDVSLSKKYNLIKLIPFLEVPLDSKVSQGLRKAEREETNMKKSNLPKWPGIAKLKKKDSHQYQEFASKYANSIGLERIELDLIFWRKEETGQN